MSKPKVGFIGVGFMGHGMAKNILQGGYKVMVKGNRNRAPVESLVGMGATEAATPKEMAESCDVIFMCLSNSPQVEATVRGAEGIMAGGKPGLIVVDTTTANPVSTMALAAELEAAGMKMVDAPLGRTPVEAEAGTLDAMVGADDETFAKVQPIIDCWAGTISHMGPVGAGHKMKLIMNFISMGTASVYAEAITLGAAVGISPGQVQQVIGGSRMGCAFFETFTDGCVARNPEAHKFSIANAAKDIGYVGLMAADAGIVNPMGAAARNIFAAAVAQGKGGDYVPFVADFVAAQNGMDLEAEAKKGKG